METTTARSPRAERAVPSPSPAFGRGRRAAVVAPSLSMLAAAGALGYGLATRVVDVGMRDSQGYVTGVVADVHSDGNAVVSARDQLDNGTALLDLPDEGYGPLKVEVRSLTGAVFVGVADADDVEEYLAGVSHARVVTFEGGRHPSYEIDRGTVTPQPPAQVEIWHAAAAGPGLQTLAVPATDEDLSVVIMRPDAAGPVDAELRAGTRMAWMDELADVLFGLGVGLGAVGALGLRAALRRPHSRVGGGGSVNRRPAPPRRAA